MKKALVRLVLTAGAVTVVLWVMGHDRRARLRVAAGRRARYLRGRWQGVRYRLAGEQPDPWADDNVLADRVRSELGPIEKQLDVPRIHVLVHDRTATLHGEVPSWQTADRIVTSVLRTSGIAAVESYLHVGIGREDTRPSEGRLHAGESHALRTLLEAAMRAGAPRDRAVASVRAVLSAFADRIPRPERDHVLAHLPADVRPLATPPRRTGKPRRVRTVPELVADVAEQSTPGGVGVTPGREGLITESVLAALRGLVPEEADDIAAVLPAELRAFWNTAVPV
jgi:uncharacterized protein (DUF2267 family)